MRLLVLVAIVVGIPIAALQGQGQATQVVNGAIVPAQRVPPSTLDICSIDTEGRCPGQHLWIAHRQAGFEEVREALIETTFTASSGSDPTSS
jgi:hypothetical protein